MGVDPRQLLVYVVRPALNVLALPGGTLAEKLIIGTAAQESRFQYLHQLGEGPALSLWQIEPVTAIDTLRRAPAAALDRLDGMVPGTLPVQSKGTLLGPIVDQLPGNLYLGAAMCRLVYYMKPFTMHEHAVTVAEAPEWCAWVWKKYYNTIKGKGATAEFLNWWDWFKLDSLWKGDEAS